MGLRHQKLARLVSLLIVFAVGGNLTSAWAQETNLPIAPTPADSTIPEVGPNPVDPNPVDPNQLDTTTQPVIDPNLLAPPRPNRPRPSTTSPVSTSRNSNRNNNNNSFSPRLSRSAPIMGDSFAPSLIFQDELGLGTRELPQGGGATRSKIAENSSSLPMDRLIFNYNHFRNAIDENLVESTNVDRFTAGFERTFHDQMMSIEVRMPFVADNDFGNAQFTRNGSTVGNLSVTLKGVLVSDRDSLIAAGLTIDTPTGGGSTLNNITDELLVNTSNDALHLSPFLGFLFAPGGGIAHQGFVQVDVATNANALEFIDTEAGGTTNTTELLEQTLLYLDYSFSKQLYHAGRSSRGSCDIRRVLGLAELHYTTTLENSDVVLSGTANNPIFEITSAGNRLDVVNLTLGLHTEFNNGAQLRLGTVAPLTEGDDRFFDFEFQAQLNILLR